MASLYIKDAETNELAHQLARRRGLSKTAAVNLALRHELERDAPDSAAQRPVVDILEEFWRSHPLGEPTGLEADKAFYDSLYEDDPD